MQAIKQGKRFTVRYRLMAILCLGLFVVSCLHGMREVSQKRFMLMVKDHEVQQITIVNGTYVDVWLKPYAVTRSRYNNMFREHNPDEPHFLLRISSEKAFRQELAKVSPKFSITSEERRGLLGI